VTGKDIPTTLAKTKLHTTSHTFTHSPTININCIW